MAKLNILIIAFLATIITLIMPLPSSGDDGSFFGSDCGNNKSHNAEFGNRGFFDKLLYSDLVQVDSTWLRKISKDVTYPYLGQQPIGYITYMEVLDQYTDGNGGCAFLKSGGIGQQTVTFHLKTQRSKGFNFRINIYGLDNVCVNKQ